jgi:GT2 family glycosyltransferase
VDDCSTDGTREIVRQARGVRLVELPEPSGPSKARNAAVGAAQASLLAFTDADCRPTPNWLEEGLAAFERGDADILAGRVEIELDARPSRAALLDAARHLNQERYAAHGWGATANLWLRRSTFEQVGPFNPRLFPGEDEEFGRRAVAAGATIAYGADVAVLHPPRARARDLWRKSYRSGVSAAQQRAHADEALGGRHVIWTRPGAYIPNRGLFGIERLENRGIRVGPLERFALKGMQYFCIQLPIAVGNLAGSRAERRQRVAST